ncbi:MAG: hypothetical protein ACO3JL_03240, partial [Myxococcota bacterium]
KEIVARLGFLGLLLAGALGALAVMTRHTEVRAGAQLAGALAIVVWGLGQAWSFVVARRSNASAALRR